jgi:hypothetical protein
MASEIWYQSLPFLRCFQGHTNTTLVVDETSGIRTALHDVVETVCIHHVLSVVLLFLHDEVPMPLTETLTGGNGNGIQLVLHPYANAVDRPAHRTIDGTRLLASTGSQRVQASLDVSVRAEDAAGSSRLVLRLPPACRRRTGAAPSQRAARPWESVGNLPVPALGACADG